MQFKHPEILWALLLLLIPIFIHLFQLRRFKKVLFTNVAMLQKVVAESRKSNTLKKWLLLLSRLLLLVALVLAFAQPFFAKKTALQEKEWVVYLDDSFSMQAKTNGLSLLETATQDLIKTLPQNQEISVFTNTQTFKKGTAEALGNRLLGLTASHRQLTLKEVVLKASTLFGKKAETDKTLIVISDFQNRFFGTTDSVSDVQLRYVKLSPDKTLNVAIDSVYLGNAINEQIELRVLASGVQKDQNVPISLYDGTKLIAKTAIRPNANNMAAEVVFSLPSSAAIQGFLNVADDGLSYDNNFYFNIEERPKVNVLTISEAADGYLKRIFTDDEFVLTSTTLNTLNYSQIEVQNLIVLNGLETIPNSLQTVLQSFKNGGGTVVVVPSGTIDFDSYTNLISPFFNLQFEGTVNATKKITKIAFGHPLYDGVFEKQVKNFEYPEVSLHHQVRSGAPKILSFANDEGFLIGGEGIYLFTAPLDREFTNFKNAPLIVPTFYQMGISSFENGRLYYTIGMEHTIDVEATLDKDRILKLVKQDEEIIPRQQVLNNKIRLTMNETLTSQGSYGLVSDTDTIQHLAFNHGRQESDLAYTEPQNTENTQVHNSVPSVFEVLSKDNSVTEYWRWFVIFALVFALVELLIQKFLS